MLRRSRFVPTSDRLFDTPNETPPATPPIVPPVVAHTPPPPLTPPAPVRQVADPAAEIQRLSNEVSNTRAEAAAYRIDGKKAQEAVEAANARITELQTESDRRVVEATNASNTRVTSLQNRTIEAELKAAAIAAGLQDVDLLPLIKRDAINMDDAGTVTGIPEAIAEFKTSKPSYFGAARAAEPPPVVVTGSRTPPPAPNQQPVTDDVRTMPKAEYEATKKATLAGIKG